MGLLPKSGGLLALRILRILHIEISPKNEPEGLTSGEIITRITLITSICYTSTTSTVVAIFRGAHQGGVESP